MTGVFLPQNVSAEEEGEKFVSTPFESPTENETSETETFSKDNEQSTEQPAEQPASNNETTTQEELKQENNETQPAAQSEDQIENKTDTDKANSSEDKIENPEEKAENAENKVDQKPVETEELQNDPQQNMLAIINFLKQYEGKTIVALEYEGSSNLTLPTVKIAATQHVGDTFTAESGIRDMEIFLNTGYFYDVYPKIEEVPEGIVLTYHLLENPILKDIVFVGNTIEKTADLERLMTIHRGDVLNSVRLHDNITAIQERYRGTGYVLMKVTDHHMDEEGVLTIKINEGILEGYSVKGNKKTKDKVILREMRQKPGEVFNANLARRSMQRVNNLGFFEDVNVKMNPGVEPNAIIMEIEVKEKRTGTFGVGAGYSSEDGIIGMVSISDTNFRGRGDAISATYEMSGDDEDAHGFVIKYRKPWLDRHETAGQVSFYNRTYEFDDYDTDGRLKEEYMRKYVGGEFTFSRPISEYSTNFITLRHRKDEYVKHVSSGRSGNRSGADGAKWRKDNFGTTRSITLEHVTDTRDNIYNPTVGGRVNLSAELGGLLGGDFDFQKISIDHQQFFKAGHAQVWALRTKGGIGFGDMTEFNQYRIGGQDSLRGYREDQFRGDRMILGTLEYRFPLFSKVQGALFTDWGSAWDTGFKPDEFHGSIGIGVSLNTPLGPLRLDYGRGSQGGRVHFSVGGAF
ncbi:MAG: BamA/TamA family outer membrane protein [Selenomonadaceae bacterium]|nr:BamA/TamA family outer membrane protein [Selenomonadaceae bacterium]